jgi:hypothetical protein
VGLLGYCHDSSLNYPRILHWWAVKGKRFMQRATTVTTGINEVNPTVTTVTTVEERKLSKEQVLGCDMALTMYNDLISDKYREWYCKMFYEIGRERFATLAAQARADGKNPARLFSFLLKNEGRKS